MKWYNKRVQLPSVPKEFGKEPSIKTVLYNYYYPHISNKRELDIFVEEYLETLTKQIFKQEKTND